LLPDLLKICISASNAEDRASEYGEITKAGRNRYDIFKKCDLKAS
jgi:hypothetical protein